MRRHNHLPAILLWSLALAASCKGDTDDTGEGIVPGDPITQTIDLEGGSITASTADGAEVTLDFPANALYGPTEVTLTPNDGHEGELLRVDVSPGGLVLRQAATLTVTLPDSVDLSDDSLIAVGAHDDVVPVPTSRDAQVLSASVSMLGVQTPDDEARSHTPGSGSFAVADYPCEIRSQLAANKMAELVSHPGQTELAVQLYRLQQSVLEDDGCATDADGMVGELTPIACEQYQAAIDASATAEFSSTRDFDQVVSPIFHWAGEAIALGQTCLDQPDVTVSAEDFMTPVAAVGTRFLDWYQGELDGVDTSNFESVRYEARGLFDFIAEFSALGLEGHTERLIDDLLHPTVEKFRASAYSTVQSSNYTHPLTLATDAGFAQPRQIIGANPEPPGGPLGFPFPYLDEDVHADIQYALSDLSVTVDGNIVTLGGGDSPGNATTAASFNFTEDDEVVLAGTVRGLTCWNGDALDAKDQIVVKIDGKEVQTLSKSTATGNFFASDVTLDVDTFFDANGIDFVDGNTYELTVERTRPLTGEQEIWCNPYLLGPDAYTLFTIELTAESSVETAFKQTWGELSVEANAVDHVSGDEVNLADTIDINSLGLQLSDMPYTFADVSETASVAAETSTLETKNVSLSVTESGNTVTARLQGEAAGTTSGPEDEAWGTALIDWTVNFRMQPDGQDAFHTARVHGSVTGNAVYTNQRADADVYIDGAFGSTHIVDVDTPSYEAWNETVPFDQQFTNPDSSTSNVSVHVVADVYGSNDSGETTGSRSVSFDVTLTLTR